MDSSASVPAPKSFEIITDPSIDRAPFADTIHLITALVNHAGLGHRMDALLEFGRLHTNPKCNNPPDHTFTMSCKVLEDPTGRDFIGSHYDVTKFCGTWIQPTTSTAIHKHIITKYAVVMKPEILEYIARAEVICERRGHPLDLPSLASIALVDPHAKGYAKYNPLLTNKTVLAGYEMMPGGRMRMIDDDDVPELIDARSILDTYSEETEDPVPSAYKVTFRMMMKDVPKNAASILKFLMGLSTMTPA